MTKIDHKIQIPDYRIIRKIGEGGMSVVYLAFQESLKREVALKIMRPVVTDEENVVKRFEQEAEIIAKLYHPNIVNIYEVGHIDDEVLFYSMPYLQHGDLTTFAYQNDEELKTMLAGICDGLSYAHTQGVVHRDIKPENILFDQFGNVQIADFGIALSTGRRRFTKDSRIIGSVYYMSPEQAQSKHVDARSDVYGLGAILYEILTGEPVFDEDSDLSVMMAHLSNPVPSLPAELAHWQTVIDRCLAKSPNQRFQNMTDLKQAVLAVGQKPSKLWLHEHFKTAAFTLVLLGAMGLVWYQISNVTVSNQATVSPSEPAKSNIQSNAAPAPPEQEVLEVEDSSVPNTVNTLSDLQVESLLQKAKRNIADKQLTTPADNNALDQILTLLRNLPDHQPALRLLSEVMAGYYDLLYQAVQNNNLTAAKSFADSVSEVRHRTILVNEALLIQLEQNTDLERSLLIGAVVEKVKAAKQSLNQQLAQTHIDLIDQVIPGQKLIDELLDTISTMLKPGQVLSDKLGLKTVVITPQYKSQQGLLNYGFAVTQSEITWAQFDRFVQATQRPLSRCKSKIKANMIFSQRNYNKPGFKVEKDMPVVCVTWQDANQYASWLSQQTGLKYRLPTAREWQHTMKLSKQSLTCGMANLAGAEFPEQSDISDLYDCDDGSTHVARVDRYAKNKLGLLGMYGNVSEWLSGCEELGKFKAIFNPDDMCDNNPIIGRSWLSGPSDTGDIQQVNYGSAWTHIGFRLVRDLRKE